jgi:hypothetical protein
MDNKRFQLPPPRPIVSHRDGPGLSSVQKLRDGSEESPVSEYSTPIGSPTGRNSPYMPASSPQPFSPRGPHPSRPPRPNEVMPLQAATARNCIPARSPPRPGEDLPQYWNRVNKGPPKTTLSQTPEDGSASEDSITSTSTPPRSDLPQPQNTTPPSPAPRKAQLIPPSSAKKGGSSLYSQGTSFSPILEESPDPTLRGRNSVASSRVVPDSWSSHPDDYNFDRIQEKIEEGEDGRNSNLPASPESPNSMHDDTTGLVRQASMGKKMKPSLTKIRNSSENISNKKNEMIGLATITAGVAAGALAPSLERFPSPAARNSPSKGSTGNRTIIIDSSPSDSRSSSQDSGNRPVPGAEPIGRSRSPLALGADRSARQPSSPLVVVSRPISKGPSMSDKVPSNRRPPHLDMEAVRDSETRGSITSLPDLIRRATRLAANLDRGKTSSRTGMREFSEKKEHRRRSGSISDILAAFPPPSRGTPDGTRPNSRFPSPFPSRLNQRMSYLTSQESSSTQVPLKRRRCCGMSLPTFLVIMLLLVILVTAAIVVPIVLIVLPRQRQAAANATGPPSLGNCPDSRPCQNGGISVVSDDSCRCICANGFTGDRCGTVTDPGCTTTDIGIGTEQFPNATLGNAIPRLLSGASTNYSIPLNSSAILSLFSTNNLSCTSENALVTFNSQSMQARDVAQKTASEDPLPSAPSASPLQPTPIPRSDLSWRLAQRQVGTSNGIVFQMSSTFKATPTSSSPWSTETSVSSSPSSAGSPASSSSSSLSSSRTPSPETIDFARIAVLFVFERTGQLNAAVQAQENIQDFLFSQTNRTDTTSLSLSGIDLSLNLANFSIALGNGTEVGGKGDGDGHFKQSSTKRSTNA